MSDVAAARSQVVCVWGEVAAHWVLPGADEFEAVYDLRAQAQGRAALTQRAFEPSPLPGGSGGAIDWLALAAALRERHSGSDLLLIQAGIELPEGWHRLLAQGYRDGDRVGAVCPLNDALDWCSPFDGARPAWMGVAEVMRWLAVLSRGERIELPAPWLGCLLLRAEVLASFAQASGAAPAVEPAAVASDAVAPDVSVPDATMPDATALELAAALQAGGWSIVACDWLFVGRPPDAASPTAFPSIEPARLTAFMTASPFGRLRHAFGEAGPRGAAGMPPARPISKPVQLHVAHSWGGGLERWIRDYCDADETRCNLVLRSIGTWGAFGQRIALYRSAADATPLREWLLRAPITSIAATHAQYRQLLDDVIREFGVQAILVSSAIGHSLDVFDTGLPTLWVAHDYFPFCPALVIHHGDVCRRCGQSELESCQSGNPLNRYFKDTSSAHWLTIRQRFFTLVMGGHVQWVAPSESVGRHYRELAPVLAGKPLTVIGHGVDEHPAWRVLRAPMADSPHASHSPRRLRIVVLGSIAPHKGQALLRQAVDALARIVDIHLLGSGDDGAAFRGQVAQVVPRYAPEELPALLANIKPDIGLLLSTAPETFSYTLSELWQAGIVPVATARGGFADRIDDGVDGFLFEPTADALLALLKRLDGDRALLTQVRANVAALPPRSRADMVRDYHRLLPLAGRPGTPFALLGSGAPDAGAGVLRIAPNARFADVLREFIDYAIGKVEHSPRLGAGLRRTLLWPVRRLRRRLG